jgi:putative transposase
MCESFYATLECELLERLRLRTAEEAETAVFEFVESWYNSRRRYWALNYHSPIEYESKHLSAEEGTK